MNRREFVSAISVAAAGAPVFAESAALKLFSADVHPLSISSGSRRGLVLEVVQRAIANAGYQTELIFLPFAEGMARTQSENGALMTPIARVPQREDLFAWVAKIVDIPQAIGMLDGTAPSSAEEAKVLKSIGVVKGGVQEAYMRGAGLTNIVVFTTGAEVGKAMVQGEVQGWYASAPEIAWFFSLLRMTGRLAIGAALQSAPVWLAANKMLDLKRSKRLADSMEELAKSGAIDAIYRSYVQT